MKQELPYFYIGSAYGGWQEWFSERMMRLGGCAAVTACDCSIYFELYKGRKALYPFDARHVSREDYLRFGSVMKPYLHPRWTGIDRLDTYIDGFGKFLQNRGENTISMTPWEGERALPPTREIIRHQIDEGWPIPCLTLKHTDPAMDDYVWHWYLLTGYEIYEDAMLVKVVTYGSWRWLDLAMIWNTGHSRKGGLVLFREQHENPCPS